MAIHVLAVHRDTVGTEQAAGNSLAAAYSVGVLCWLLSAGVYIAAKWVSTEMPPWALCFWRVLIAFAILLPIVQRHFSEMLVLVRARGLELLFIGGMLHASSTALGESNSLSQAMENIADLLQNYETISGDADEVANRIAEAIKMVGQADFIRPDESTVH